MCADWIGLDWVGLWCGQGAGTMFCRKAQWEAAKFPRELFYDSNSKRGRVLMHSKV